MKISYKHFLIFCAIIICSIKSYGQQFSFAVDTIIGWPSTSVSNTLPYSFKVVVHNYSSQTFNGTLSIGYKTNQDSATLDMGNSTDSISANSSDSILINGFMFDSTTAFKLGGNVVVVWPHNSNGMQTIFVTDTFKTYVWVSASAGIHDFNKNNKMEIYPVPTNDIIFIKNLLPEKTFEYVRITDILGKQQYYSTLPRTTVNTSFLEEGIYFIELKENDKPARIAKFIIRR